MLYIVAAVVAAAVADDAPAAPAYLRGTVESYVSLAEFEDGSVQPVTIPDVSVTGSFSVETVFRFGTGAEDGSEVVLTLAASQQLQLTRKGNALTMTYGGETVGTLAMSATALRSWHHSVVSIQKGEVSWYVDTVRIDVDIAPFDDWTDVVAAQITLGGGLDDKVASSVDLALLRLYTSTFPEVGVQGVFDDIDCLTMLQRESLLREYGGLDASDPSRFPESQSASHGAVADVGAWAVADRSIDDHTNTFVTFNGQGQRAVLPPMALPKALTIQVVYRNSGFKSWGRLIDLRQEGRPATPLHQRTGLHIARNAESAGNKVYFGLSKENPAPGGDPESATLQSDFDTTLKTCVEVFACGAPDYRARWSIQLSLISCRSAPYRWHNMVVSVAEDGMSSMWIDGRLVARKKLSFGVNTDRPYVTNAISASQGGGSGHHGDIAYLAMYNRAFTDAECLGVFAGGFSDASSLLHNWKFDGTGGKDGEVTDSVDSGQSGSLPGLLVAQSPLEGLAAIYPLAREGVWGGGGRAHDPWFPWLTDSHCLGNAQLVGRGWVTRDATIDAHTLAHFSFKGVDRLELPPITLTEQFTVEIVYRHKDIKSWARLLDLRKAGPAGSNVWQRPGFAILREDADDGNKVYFTALPPAGPSGYLNSKLETQVNKWHHLVLSVNKPASSGDGSDAETAIWIDGKLMNFNKLGDVLSPGVYLTNAISSSSGGGSNHNGEIAFCRFFNRALDDAEVMAVYGGTFDEPTAVQHSWSMDGAAIDNGLVRDTVGKVDGRLVGNKLISVQDVAAPAHCLTFANFQGDSRVELAEMQLSESLTIEVVYRHSALKSWARLLDFRQAGSVDVERWEHTGFTLLRDDADSGDNEVFFSIIVEETEATPKQTTRLSSGIPTEVNRYVSCARVSVRAGNTTVSRFQEADCS